MVKIPESYGIAVKPTTQTQIAQPNNLGQQTAQVIQQVGGNIMNVAIQAEYVRAREEDAFNASQVMNFKTELSRFDNEKRVALSDLPAVDGTAIIKAQKQTTIDRQKFINNYVNQFSDNKKVAELIKRQANVESVDFEYDVNRIMSNKKKEFGQNTIYRSIYDINNRLASGGNAEKLRNDLQNTLQTGFQAGLIDQQDIIRETEKQKNIIEDLNRKYEATRMANLVASGKLALDPNDSDDRKIGELAYQKSLANTQKQGIDPTVATVDFIEKTGYIPKEAKRIWSTQLNIGNAQQKLETAYNIASIVESNPNLQNQFNSDDIHYATEINKRANAGLPAQQIIDYAEKEISKFQSMDRQAKINITKDNKGKFQKSIQSEFKSFASDYSNWFSSDPRINAEMETTFKTLAYDYFVNNERTTPESAIEFAKNQLKAEYDQTNVGEKKVMRYAPEVFYKKYNPDTSWINKQFQSKIAEHVLVPDLKGIEKNYSIIPHPNYIASGKPAYYITEKKGDYGRMDILLDNNNRPVVFAPDIAKADFFKKTQQEYAKNRKGLSKQEIADILEEKNNSAMLNKAVVAGAKGKFEGL